MPASASTRSCGTARRRAPKGWRHSGIAVSPHTPTHTEAATALASQRNANTFLFLWNPSCGSRTHIHRAGCARRLLIAAFDTAVPTEGCVPDGCALDCRGKLWVAMHGAGEVRRYDPLSGEHLATVTLPAVAGTLVTSCAFGGEEL
eukprot:COSAG01_NODE_11025_length_2025_cov_1.149013_1_plen_146_part_00